jgi:hypothetical protein
LTSTPFSSTSTPSSSPSTPRRSTSSMSVGFDDSMSSDLTSYYCLHCDSRHGLGSDDTSFVYSANTLRMKKVSTASSGQLPGRWRTIKSMLYSTQSTETKESAPHVPAGVTMVRTAPVTIIATILLLRKSGKFHALL